MPQNSFDKLFSPTEANELIPTLELLLRDLQGSAKSLREQIRELCRNEPEAQPLSLGFEQLIQRFPPLRQPATQMAAAAQKIEDLGCLLKDIDLGLVDFPCEIADKRVVFLCWQSGERAVLAWHPIDAGFAQRRALPGVESQYLN